MKLKLVGEQVAAVVGASSGIGRETALRFAKRGAKVVLAARSEAGLRSLEDEIRGLGGQATSVVADVSEFEQVETVARVAVEEYGRLDTWVHLAAVGRPARAHEVACCGPSHVRRSAWRGSVSQVNASWQHDGRCWSPMREERAQQSGWQKRADRK